MNIEAKKSKIILRLSNKATFISLNNFLKYTIINRNTNDQTTLWERISMADAGFNNGQ
jgi:hypothetical protein